MSTREMPCGRPQLGGDGAQGEVSMNRSNRWLVVLMMATLGLALAASGCKRDDTPDENIAPIGTFAPLQERTPKSTDLGGEWKRSGRMLVLIDDPTKATVAKDDLADYAAISTDSSFSAELPLLAEYKHQAVLIQKYKPAEGEGCIVLEIHQMAQNKDTPDYAYGYVSVAEPGQVFDHPLWTIGRKAPGRIVFAKDSYMVRVKSYTDDQITVAAPEAALERVAQAVANKLGGRNQRPRIVSCLPSQDRVVGSEVYVCGPLALKKAQEKYNQPLIGSILGPVVGNAPVAFTLYRTAEGKTNLIFVLDRRLASDAPDPRKIQDFLATADKSVLNSFVHAVTSDRYTVVGSFNAEEEGLQLVIPRILESLGR